MFSALRLGNLFYILEKGESPKLRVGYVVSVSTPQPKYNTNYQHFGNMESTVDITVKIGDEQLEFKQVPSSLSIASFNTNNVVISETKEAMSLEVESMLKASKLIIESIPYHEKAIIACEDMLKELNPQFAKLKDLEEKINNLETKVGGIESKLDDICTMLSKALLNK